ncbi:MAG: toxic anion resistance protein [Lachnospiraceae bacterium]|nr:toxic anion resistance protein [Lachnospiraceae bacterium]
MSDITQLKEEVPVLTFGEENVASDLPSVAPAPAAPTLTMGNETPTATVDDSMLSDEEKRQAEEFAKKIDITDSNAVMNYGAGTQKKMSEFSEKTLSGVRTKDMGEVGDMISGLINQLKDFDVDDNEKGLKGLFKKSRNKLETIKTQYSKVETNVNTISGELEKHQVTLMKDIDTLDKMYDLNLVYFKELTMYIIAGKKKLQEARTVELPAMEEKARQSGLAEDAQAAKDYAALIDRFEKKIYDIELTRTIALQMGPQIRMVQSSDTMMVEKIQTTLVNTIPLWKNQMVIAIGVEHASQAARAQREVSDMTNELLKKNADKLKVATIETAKESERGIVDIETLKHTNEQLISTLDEVLNIQKEGKEKRAQAEVELTQIEGQLKEKLLEVASNAK